MLRGWPETFSAEIVDERTAKNAKFPALVTEAEERRKFARRLAKLREKKALSQTVVAARMGTSASVVSKLEADGDVKMSTIQRYCAAIGKKFSVESRPGAPVCAIATARLFRWIAGRAMRRARPRLMRLGRGRVSRSRLMRLRRQSVSWLRAMCRRSSRGS
jgi:transcriptional regulator with XRE-family HTH domain